MVRRALTGVTEAGIMDDGTGLLERALRKKLEAGRVAKGPEVPSLERGIKTRF